MQIHISFLIICALIGPTLGQSIPITGQAVPDLTAYDSVVTSLMQKYQVPGVALAVARDGRLVFARGYGYADTDLQLPVQPDSLFRLGSVTKPHTAAAIFKLIEQGKLSLLRRSLSSPISNRFPAPWSIPASPPSPFRSFWSMKVDGMAKQTGQDMIQCSMSITSPR
jgi:hypothetical protein